MIGSPTILHTPCAERQAVGSIIITIPDIPDSQLIYNDDETRQILKFFWPDRAKGIDELTITDDVRRLAQTALIAAVDGSYAMGYIDLLFNAISGRIRNPNGNVSALARRLARNFIRHWWHHATQNDLLEARIYDSVRGDVARNLRYRLSDVSDGAIVLRRGATTLCLLTRSSASA